MAVDHTKMDGVKASGRNRGTHHGDYSEVPVQLLEGGASTVAKPLNPYMDPRRQVTKALRARGVRGRRRRLFPKRARIQAGDAPRAQADPAQ